MSIQYLPMKSGNSGLKTTTTKKFKKAMRKIRIPPDVIVFPRLQRTEKSIPFERF